MSVPTLFQLFASDAIVKSNLQAFLLCFDIGTAPASATLEPWSPPT
jgi:hypothetical protein